MLKFDCSSTSVCYRHSHFIRNNVASVLINGNVLTQKRQVLCHSKNYSAYIFYIYLCIYLNKVNAQRIKFICLIPLQTPNNCQNITINIDGIFICFFVHFDIAETRSHCSRSLFFIFSFMFCFSLSLEWYGRVLPQRVCVFNLA